MDSHGHHEKSALPAYINTPTSIGLGFLIALSMVNFWHELTETSFSLDTIAIVLVVAAAGYGIGRLLARHLSVCSHDHIDSANDIWFIIIIIASSLIHTIFDGSVVHEAWGDSPAQGLIVAAAILGHEAVRTAIMYKVLRTMSFPKMTAGLSVFGVSLIGILIGISISSALSIEKYEGIAHLITGGLFIAVATDLFYYLRSHNGKLKPGFIVLGVVAVIILQFLSVGH